MKKEFQLTQAGIEKLKTELEQLKLSRVEVAEKLRVAREHGDLSENAEYHNARDEQGKLEARISEIDYILRNTEPIIEPIDPTTIELGNTVVLKSEKGEAEFTVVGSVEANPTQNKISNQSPIGKELLGKKVNDKIVITLPAGSQTYTIKSIK